MGFYKYDNEVLIGPANNVYNSAYELRTTNLEEYSLPVDGWHYFESEDAAKEFFGIEDIEDVINE